MNHYLLNVYVWICAMVVWLIEVYVNAGRMRWSWFFDRWNSVEVIPKSDFLASLPPSVWRMICAIFIWVGEPYWIMIVIVVFVQGMLRPTKPMSNEWKFDENDPKIDPREQTLHLPVRRFPWRSINNKSRINFWTLNEVKGGCTHCFALAITAR